MTDRDDTLYAPTESREVIEGRLAHQVALSVTVDHAIRDAIQRGTEALFAPLAETLGGVAEAARSSIESYLEASCAIEGMLEDYIRERLEIGCGQTAQLVDICEACERIAVNKLEKREASGTLSDADRVNLQRLRPGPQSPPPPLTENHPTTSGVMPEVSFLGAPPPIPPLPDQAILNGLVYAAVGDPPAIRLDELPQLVWLPQSQDRWFLSLTPTPMTRAVWPIFSMNGQNVAEWGKLHLNFTQDTDSAAVSGLVRALQVDPSMVSLTEAEEARTQSYAIWGQSVVDAIYDGFGLWRPPAIMGPLSELPPLPPSPQEDRPALQEEPPPPPGSKAPGEERPAWPFTSSTSDERIGGLPPILAGALQGMRAAAPPLPPTSICDVLAQIGAALGVPRTLIPGCTPFEQIMNQLASRLPRG